MTLVGNFLQVPQKSGFAGSGFTGKEKVLVGKGDEIGCQPEPGIALQFCHFDTGLRFQKYKYFYRSKNNEMQGCRFYENLLIMAYYINSKNPNSNELDNMLASLPVCPGTCIFIDVVNSTELRMIDV